MHLSGLRAEHQAAHSFSLASNQRAAVDSARHRRIAQLSELQKIKGSVENRIETLKNGLIHRVLLNRVSTYIESDRAG